jgi:hypothetical protein
MKARGAVSLVVLGLCLPAFAAEDKPDRLARAKADEAAQATIKGDFDKLLDLTYAEIIKRGGGREKMLAHMKAQVKDWKTKGYEFRSAKVGETSQVVAGGDKLFAVVPLTLEIKLPDGTLTLSSFLLGISADKGKTWTFINGDKAHDEEIQTWLPDLPPSLKLPDKSKPVFKSNK